MQLDLLVPRPKEDWLEARSDFAVNSGNSDFISPIAQIRDTRAARGKPIKGLLLTRNDQFTAIYGRYSIFKRFA